MGMTRLGSMVSSHGLGTRWISGCLDAKSSELCPSTMGRGEGVGGGVLHSPRLEEKSQSIRSESSLM